MKFTTRLLHGKSVRRYASGSTLPEIIQANAFRYDTAEEVERVFAHTAPGYSYSRLANPTVFAFEQRINDTEGGSSAVAFSSGMSAVFTAFINFLSSGDEIIVSSKLYGGTICLFELLHRFEINARYVNHMTPE